MASKGDVTSQNQFGLFEYTKSVTHGDPYGSTDKAKAESKDKGKQFSIQPVKKGKTPEVYFSPKQTESVFVGSKYTTLYDEDRKYQLEKKAKQIVPAPFKPSTPSNRPEGKGAYFGTFGKWQNMKDSNSYDKRAMKKGEGQLAPKNFLTNPPLKGHVGLLSCRSSNGQQGVVGEYHYEPEPPQPKKASGDPVTPFKPSNPGKKGLYSQDCGAGFTRMTYSSEGPSARPPKNELLSKPWSPASVAKTIKGPTGRIYATLNMPPEYTPLGPKPPKKDTRMNDPAKNVAHPWKPNSSSKTMRSCSIVNMRRNISSSGSLY